MWDRGLSLAFLKWIRSWTDSRSEIGVELHWDPGVELHWDPGELSFAKSRQSEIEVKQKWNRCWVALRSRWVLFCHIESKVVLMFFRGFRGGSLVPFVVLCLPFWQDPMKNGIVRSWMIPGFFLDDLWCALICFPLVFKGFKRFRQFPWAAGFPVGVVSLVFFFLVFCAWDWSEIEVEQKWN